MKLSLKLNSSWRRRQSQDDRRYWLLRAIAVGRRSEARSEWRVEIFWKRLIATGLALLFAVYLLAVTALFLWWSRQPANQVGWIDLALAPVRWETLRQKRGDTAIAAALERLRARDYAEAYYGLRVGLSRSPGHAQGRLTLARMMFGSDPLGALKLLEDGLKQASLDPEVVQTLFSYYTMLGANARARATAEQELARTPPRPAEIRALLSREYATCLLAANDPAAALRALDAIGSVPASETVFVQRVRVLSLVTAQRYDEARALLREFKPANAFDRGSEMELAIATGDAATVESVLRQMRAENGDRPAPYLLAFRVWHRMGRATLRDQAEEAFLLQFAGNDTALQQLAATAVELDLPATILRAQQVAVSHGLNPFAFRLHLVETLLRRGEFDEAFRRVREIEAKIATLPAAQRFYPEFIQRLARACVAGGEQQTPALLNQLGELRGRARPGMYLLAVKVLRQAGFPDSALQIATLGLRSYPYTDQLLTSQRDLEATVRLAKESAASTARNETSETKTTLPRTAAAALEAIDAALARGEFTAARDLQRAIRSAAPAWLASAENGLARREVEVALATQDAITARAVTHTYLQRPRPTDDLARLAEIARTFAAENRVADARWLKEELEAAGVTERAAQILRAVRLPDDLAPRLVTAQAFFAAFDAQIDAGQPSEALRLLEQVRKREPAWLEAARSELLVREVRARFAVDQRPLALAAFKELVVRAGASRSAAFKLVRDQLAAGETESAQVLAREVVRLLPDDKAAVTLLREAEAAAAAGN